MHKSLWNKDYILLLQGTAVSHIGDLLYSVAIGYWVYEKTGSSALMGLLSSISMFMTMFVMPFSGTIIDRCDRKAVIVGMDVLRGLLMLGVGILAFSGQLSVGAVLVTAFLASACGTFFTPAVATLMIDLIPPDDMVRGQSLHSGVMTGLGVVGKALSGALVVLLGVPTIVIVNGVSYLFSALTELFITVPQRKMQEKQAARNHLLSDFALGLREIRNSPYLRLFIPGALVINLLCAGPLSLMLPFALEKGFTLDMYGYLMSIQTAASLLGVCLLGIVKLKPGTRYWMLTLGFLGSILFVIPAYISSHFLLVCIMLFLSFFANTLGNSILNASLALALPEGNRGAILGLVSAASVGGSALSTLAYGFLCDRFPLYLVFLAGNLLAVFPTLHLCLHKDMKGFILTH